MEHNHVPEMVSEVLRGKALASLVESAKITDKSGNVIDLSRLRSDGTIGDDSDVAADAPEAEAEVADEKQDVSKDA